MTNIEDKQIKGITNRLAVVLIGCTVTITAGGIGFYNGLMTKIDKVAETQNIRKIEVDMQFRNMDDKMENIKESVAELKKR